eukprot:Platyproteum_vivax@DN3624_c0_g1_i1.p1
MTSSQRSRLEKDLQQAVEVLDGKVYWVALSTAKPPQDSLNTHYFTIDYELVYENFNADFGPLNLGLTHRYCVHLNEKLACHKKRIIHWCSTAHDKRNNAAYLLCAYQIIILKRTAEEAFSHFKDVDPPFMPYRDAGYGNWDYDCKMLDCLKGLERAIRLGWYNFEKFDLNSYFKYDRIDYGDMHWIIPKKFLAFSGPVNVSTSHLGYRTWTPEDYTPKFHAWGITTVVRLNHEQYDKKKFITNGIKHVDLYFKDGSIPTWEIITRFLDVTENEGGAMAVHCKAGLGRTGTLIGCYAIKNYKFPAAQWIGWNRICRPGSILGPQQHFLLEVQDRLYSLPTAPSSLKFVTGRLPEVDLATEMKHLQVAEELGSKSHIGRLGDAGQGERLVAARATVAAKKGQQKKHSGSSTSSNPLLPPRLPPSLEKNGDFKVKVRLETEGDKTPHSPPESVASTASVGSSNSTTRPSTVFNRITSFRAKPAR